ncbi:MAG: hypothetical protein M3304_11955, partial [Actinomycetota bacterium]|nr:hypothetical protein [Actinomycetota bacterium]
MKPLLRRAFLAERDLRYDEQLRWAEDFYLYMQVLAAGARWVQLPEPYYLYQRGPRTLTRALLDLAQQHVARSAALLRTSAIAADAAVSSALRRLHRDWRGAVIEQQIRRSCASVACWRLRASSARIRNTRRCWRGSWPGPCT